MPETMDLEARRLLTTFATTLTRLAPQPLDWQRFYEFVLYAFRHAPQTAEAVGHALVQDGLAWEEAEPFVLERELVTTPPPRAPRTKRTTTQARRKRGRRSVR
jgi:hypothetical protein